MKYKFTCTLDLSEELNVYILDRIETDIAMLIADNYKMEEFKLELIEGDEYVEGDEYEGI